MAAHVAHNTLINILWGRITHNVLLSGKTWAFSDSIIDDYLVRRLRLI